MATIITVHGTFASGPDTGEKWWQHSSSFETHMGDFLEADEGELKFEPFIWSGLNSETSRRSAGSALYNKLKTLEIAGEPYSVIGHSHGGSVIAASLMESAKHKNSLGNLKSWLTIGTPFITTKKERFLFSRLGLWGKAVYVALMTVTMMLLLAINPDLLNSLSLTNIEAILALLFFFLAILLPFLLFYFSMRWLNAKKLHLYKQNTVAFANKDFQPRWLSLWHKNDEAVRGLGALKSIKLDVFAKNFAAGPISLLSIFILPVAVLMLLNSSTIMNSLHNSFTQDYGYVSKFGNIDEFVDGQVKLIHGGHSMRANSTFLIEAISYGAIRVTGMKDNLNVRELFVLIGLPILVLLFSLFLTYTMSRLANLISSLLSGQLNPLTMSQVRATALGSDTLEDVAVDAADWPMWMGKGFPPLPEPLGSNLQATSDAAVSKAVPKFRSALGSFAAAKSSKEKSDMLSEYLTWDELIHTSYFHNPQFCKLVAYALTQSEGFRASEAFRQDSDFDVVAGFYKALSSQPELP